MGTVNKQSLRQQAEQMKLAFVQLSKSKKIDSETKLFIQGMLVLLNLLIAIFLEKNKEK